jgi:hypothetical protein
MKPNKPPPIHRGEILREEFTGLTPALVGAEKEALKAEGAQRKTEREKAEAEKAGKAAGSRCR